MERENKQSLTSKWGIVVETEDQCGKQWTLILLQTLCFLECCSITKTNEGSFFVNHVV